MRLAAPLTAAFTVASCAAATPPGIDPAIPKIVTYSCEGQEMGAIFNPRARQVELIISGGMVTVLDQRVSTSGFRYSNEVLEFSGSGDEAILKPAQMTGSVSRCKIVRDAPKP